MSYTAEINRENPSCFLFLIDQSGSMSDPWAGDPNKKKADELAVIINRLLQNLVLTCVRDEKGPRDYFHVGVIGYGARGQSAKQKEAAIRSKYQVQRQPLDLQENNAKDSARQRKDAARTKYQQEQDAIAKQLQDIQDQLAKQRRDFDQKISQEKKSLPEKSWELAKLQHELRAYQQVNFAAYLKRVLLFVK